MKAKLINTIPKLKKLAKKMMTIEEFAFDTETNTLEWANADNDIFRIVDISISWGEYDNYLIPIGHIVDPTPQLDPVTVAKYLKEPFEREDVTVIGHNIKYDMHVMKRIGVHIKTPYLFDTMIASWLCDENTENGLKQSVERIFNHRMEHFNEVIAKIPKEVKKQYGLKANQKATIDLTMIGDSIEYATEDSYWTFRLYLHYLEELEKENMEKIYYKMYPPFVRVLFDMEEEGIRLDIDACNKMNEDIQSDLDNLEYEILDLVGVQFDINSSQQLAQVLFGYNQFKTVNDSLLKASFKFPVQSTTAKGVPQTNNATLHSLSQMVYKDKKKQRGVEFVKKLMDYKELAKLKTFTSKFVEVVYPDGKIHCTFNPVGADSGRLSCIAENTPITLVGEYKNIENVKRGDRVYCYDEEGNVKISTVLNRFNNGVKKCIKVTWKSQGTHELGEIICTPDHKIRTREGVWVRADSLVPGQKVTHLRRSSDKRPRIYGLNSFCTQEQLIIKEQIFGCTDPHVHLHHIDGNKSNNLENNVCLMTHKGHTSLHGNLKENKYTPSRVPRVYPVGKDSPNYMNVTEKDLEQMIHDVKGRIREVPMDFDTFKKKCKELNFNYKKVASQYQKQYVEPTREEFEECFFRNKGVKYKIQQELGIGRVHCDKLIKKYDLCFNHEIVSIEEVGYRKVYDLEVEKYHNFIANEICVHNCSNPNMQQIPNNGDKYNIRSVFIADNKNESIISCDQSNLEVRVMAHFSKDEGLINAFHNGLDLHGNTAKLMFRLDCEANDVKKKYPDLRKMGKVIAFLLQYGGSVMALEQTLNSDGMLTNMLRELKQYKNKKDLPDTLKPFWGCKTTKDMAQALMDAYFEAFPGIANFMRKQKKFAHRNEYVMTVLGRKRRLPFINSNDHKMSSYAERLSLNAPIQGSAADIMINAQIKMANSDRLKELGCKMLLQIHDECIFTCPTENCKEAIQVIRECMIYPFGKDKLLNVNLEIGGDFGSSYACGH